MPGAGPFDEPGAFYLSTPGGSGDRVSTPDDVSLDITGDIDIRIDMALDQWAPEPGFNLEFFGKFNATGDQRSWLPYIRADRRPVLRWSTDGTGAGEIDAVANAPIQAIDGQRMALRVTLDVDNTVSGWTAVFYTAPTLDGPWTQLGQSVSEFSGTTSIFASTADLHVGDVIGSGFLPITGRVYGAELRDGIDGTVVANPDFTAQAAGTTNFTDGAGLDWTVNGDAEIVGYDWEAVPNKLLAASWSWGRGSPLERFAPGEAELVFANEDRELDPANTAGSFAGLLEPRTPFRIQSVSSALDLPGASGATASTADRAAFAVVDLDVRVQLAMDDWTPGGFGRFFIGQWPNVSSNNGWVFGVSATGEPLLTFTEDGSTSITRTATAATGFTDGSDHWLRVTLDADNGSAEHDVTFYASTDGVTWTQLGATVTTAGTVTLFDSTADLAISDVLPFAGQVRYAELRDGIDGDVLANPEFDSENPGTATFNDRAGNTWSVNGTAAIAIDENFRSDEFYGFVDAGYIQDWQPPGQLEVVIPLIDMLGVLAEESLPASVYQAEILTDRPEAYWRLDESEGVRMLDSSGNGNDGFLDNGDLGVEPLIVDGRAFEAPHVGDNRGRYKGATLPVAPPVTLEAWVQTDRDLTATKSIIVVQRDHAFGSGLVLAIETSGGGSPNGELVINFFGLGTGYTARGSTRIDDGRPHHVVCTIESTSASDINLYVDGVVEDKTTVSGTDGGTWTSHLIWTVGNTVDTGQGDFGLDGVVDEAAIYGTALTAERIAAHYAAGSDGFDGDLSDARIIRVLDLIGFPDSFRDIATGDTTVGPADFRGQTVLDYFANIIESEQGYLYVAHRDGGVLRFRGRYSRITGDRSSAVLAAFTDADEPGAMHYERDGLDIEPNGIASIVNTVEARWRGGTEIVTDESSKKRFGPQTRTITTEAPTAAAAEGPGLWLLNQYSEPKSRVRGFTLRPEADRRIRRTSRLLRISDRFSLRRQPLAIGSVVTDELHVEKVAVEWRSGISWQVGIGCSDADLGTWWVWDVSEWGVDTNWG